QVRDTRSTICATLWQWRARFMSDSTMPPPRRWRSCAPGASPTRRPFVRRCARPQHVGACALRCETKCVASSPTKMIARRCGSSANNSPSSRRRRRTEMVRGEIFRLPAPRGTRGHEQRGARYALVVQADEFLDLTTVLVSPTSTSARAASFRPEITLDGHETRVLVEQTTVVDPERLGRSAGRLGARELRSV